MKNILILLFLLLSITALAESKMDSLNAIGANLFKTSCKACHNIDKKLVGPALSKVYERRDSVWIYNFIKGSQKMIADGDPIALELYSQFNEVLMPNQPYDNNQIKLILNYIKSEDIKKLSSSNSNPISRPIVEAMPYSDHFRFSNFLFWIPFTISVILGIIFLYNLTIYHDIIECNMDEKR